MKKKILAGFLVVAVLVTAGIVAARVGTAEASGRPFIGIAIIPIEDDEGALIVRVVDDSPADGNLQEGDIITALDGDAIDGPRDVVDYVREQEPGDVIVFEVMRDGAAMDVSVTVGERDENDDYGHMRGGYGRYGGGDYHDEHKRFDFDMGLFHESEQLILSETRYMTDDGVETTRKAVGTVQNINASAGTFDLLLLDESETLSFKINDDTKVMIDTTGSIAGLSADEPTLVMDVIDAEGVSDVQLVAQGEFAEMGNKRGYGMMKRDYDGFGQRGFRMGHGDNFAPPGFMERFEREGFNPQRFFFRWRSDDNGDDERRGRSHN